MRGAGRVDALDGVRALAVAAVVLYHVDHDLFPGGFVGVDLFFVLSGYLITTLLLTEHGRDGGISLRRFWGRRIRRLWPLAWVTMATIAVASLTGVWGADRQRGLPAEIGAATAQVANWYQVSHGGYVDAATAPSPLRHFWSLAIEEQFYVVWPLLLAGLLAASARRSTAHARVTVPIVPVALAALAAASIGAGWWHADSPDRAYLGTDVRLVAIVAGAAVAWWLRARPMRGPANRNGRAVAAAAGVAGVLTLAVSTFVLHADSGLLPRGGFAVVAVAAAGIVAFTLSPSGFSTAMAWPPLVWVGRISYGVYLVHWPMLVALGPDRPLVVRLLVAGPGAVAVAAGLHRLVERPMIERTVPLRWVGVVGPALVVVAVVALVIAVPVGRTPSEQVAASFDRVPDPTPPPTTRPAAGAPTSPTTTCPPPTTAVVTPDDGLTPSERSVDDPDAVACAGQTTVMVIGDSTGRGAANGLRALADPRVVVWDRTILGCSLGDEKCPDWRTAWRLDIDAIDPDVVLLYSGVVVDLHGVDDPPFMSAEATEARRAVFDEALALLVSRGAGVVWNVPAVPLRPRGLFFCDGRGTRSGCDPEWVERWNDEVRAAVAAGGQTVAELAAWTALRGATDADRPDGVHYSADALRDQAEWLVPLLVESARP